MDDPIWDIAVRGGVLMGVGIWLVAGLLSPTAISALVRNSVWGWAIE